MLIRVEKAVGVARGVQHIKDFLRIQFDMSYFAKQSLF